MRSIARWNQRSDRCSSMGAESVRTGRVYEHEVKYCLARLGFMPIGSDVNVLGAKLDLMVRNKWGGELLVECKGGKRGLRSADVVKRLVGLALYVNAVAPHHGPILPMTTFLPRVGTVAHRMLAVAISQGLIMQPETISSMVYRWSIPDSWYMDRNDFKIFHEPYLGIMWPLPSLKSVP